jgi:hypothetical protein
MNSSNFTNRQTAAALRELENAILGANPDLYEAIIEAALVEVQR